MSPIWTHRVWTVKPGREDEFVRGFEPSTLDEVPLDG